MEQGTTRGARDLPALLLRVALIASLLFLAYPSKPLLASFRRAPGEPNSSEGVARVAGDLAFYRAGSEEALVYVLADVAVDEEFMDQLGDGWEAAVDEMIEGANTLLNGVGLYIEVASIQHWHSVDTERSIVAHLDSAEQQTQRVAKHLFLAITRNDTIKFDGWAQESRGRVIVQYHREDEEQNAPLIAHEIGHLMGTGHHRGEDGCIMGRRGYPSAGTWCQHHQQVIREHLASSLDRQGL